MVLAAFGIGGAIGSMVQASLPMPRRYLTYMNLTFGAGCVPMVLMGMAPSIWVLVVCSFLLGVLFSAPMVIWGTLLQRRVPRHLLGRVASLDFFVSVSLMPVSMALAGPVADAIGVRNTFLVAGITPVVFAVVAIVWARLPDGRARPPAGLKLTCTGDPSARERQDGPVIDWLQEPLRHPVRAGGGRCAPRAVDRLGASSPGCSSVVGCTRRGPIRRMEPADAVARRPDQAAHHRRGPRRGGTTCSSRAAAPNISDALVENQFELVALVAEKVRNDPSSRVVSPPAGVRRHRPPGERDDPACAHRDARQPEDGRARLGPARSDLEQIKEAVRQHEPSKVPPPKPPDISPGISPMSHGARRPPVRDRVPHSPWVSCRNLDGVVVRPRAVRRSRAATLTPVELVET